MVGRVGFLMFKQLILVGIGGGLGSVLRYLTSVLVDRFYDNTFPLATLTVNGLGCFIIGILMGTSGAVSHDSRLLFVTGFCGGFTTFSAFAFENIRLFQNNSYLIAFTYIVGSVIIALACVWLGLVAARQI